MCFLASTAFTLAQAGDATFAATSDASSAGTGGSRSRRPSVTSRNLRLAAPGSKRTGKGEADGEEGGASKLSQEKARSQRTTEAEKPKVLRGRDDSGTKLGLEGKAQ